MHVPPYAGDLFVALPLQLLFAYHTQPRFQHVTHEPSPPLYEVGLVLIPFAGEVTGRGTNELAWSHTADESVAGV